jgi:hypothetical protein
MEPLLLREDEGHAVKLFTDQARRPQSAGERTAPHGS